MNTHTSAVTTDATAAEVLEFVAGPENLPFWSVGLRGPFVGVASALGTVGAGYSEVRTRCGGDSDSRPERR